MSIYAISRVEFVGLGGVIMFENASEINRSKES